jgi:hypothetical protein
VRGGGGGIPSPSTFKVSGPIDKRKLRYICRFVCFNIMNPLKYKKLIVVSHMTYT